MTAISRQSATAPRILVVEDEWLIASMMEQKLIDIGFEVVGPVDSVAQALQILDDNEVTAAILDVNLGRETSFPIADQLLNKNIPFILTTGYNPADLPVAYRSCRALAKPLLGDTLVVNLREILINRY